MMAKEGVRKEEMTQMAERPQIRLEFGFSTSPSYERAVSIAQRLSNYISWGEGRKLKHQVTFASEEPSVPILAQRVTSTCLAYFWRNCGINPLKMPKKSLT
jgi:hypothetical protein